MRIASFVAWLVVQLCRFRAEATNHWRVSTLAIIPIIMIPITDPKRRVGRDSADRVFISIQVPLSVMAAFCFCDLNKLSDVGWAERSERRQIEGTGSDNRMDPDRRERLID